MFVINEDKSIYITRGDVAFFSIEAKTDTGEKYKFMPGDVVRFKVCGKKDCENVVLSKDFGIESEADEVSIYLEEKDTKFGGVISKPTDFWYEVELNPYTDPQTILGYDEDGAKIFKLFPEGNEKEDEDPITPEDIPVVDKELDLTSERPVQNQAIARAIIKIREDTEGYLAVKFKELDKKTEEIELKAVSLEFLKRFIRPNYFSITLIQNKPGVFVFPDMGRMCVSPDDGETNIYFAFDEIIILEVISSYQYNCLLGEDDNGKKVVYITNPETGEPADMYDEKDGYNPNFQPLVTVKYY